MAVLSDGGGVKRGSGVGKLETMQGSCPGNVQLGRLRAWTVVRREEIHYFISFFYTDASEYFALPIGGRLRGAEETRELGATVQMTSTSVLWSHQKTVFITLRVTQYQRNLHKKHAGGKPAVVS